MSKPLKILLFEDDPTISLLLQVTLEQRGHSVQMFDNPTVCPVFEGHDKGCPKEKPCADIVITDNMMPNISGIDFLVMQRERGCKAQDVNKAIITGATLSKEALAKIESLGCKLFKKPFRISEFMAWIAQCEKRME